MRRPTFSVSVRRGFVELLRFLHEAPNLPQGEDVDAACAFMDRMLRWRAGRGYTIEDTGKAKIRKLRSLKRLVVEGKLSATIPDSQMRKLLRDVAGADSDDGPPARADGVSDDY